MASIFKHFSCINSTILITSVSYATASTYIPSIPLEVRPEIRQGIDYKKIKKEVLKKSPLEIIDFCVDAKYYKKKLIKAAKKRNKQKVYDYMIRLKWRIQDFLGRDINIESFFDLAKEEGLKKGFVIPDHVFDELRELSKQRDLQRAEELKKCVDHLNDFYDDYLNISYDHGETQEDYFSNDCISEGFKLFHEMSSDKKDDDKKDDKKEDSSFQKALNEVPATVITGCVLIACGAFLFILPIPGAQTVGRGIMGYGSKLIVCEIYGMATDEDRQNKKRNREERERREREEQKKSWIPLWIPITT